MGKVLKIAAVVAAVAVAFVPGVGPALSGMIVSGLGGTFAAVGIASTIVSGIATLGVMAAIGIATKTLGLGPSPPKVPSAATDRLRASIDPRAPRAIVFGHTAMATDMGYQEFTGANQEYLNTIIVCASHQVNSIDEIWFDQKKAWSASGGVTSEFSGYLTVTTRTAGTAANAFTITGSSSWTSSNSRNTGLAYIWLRYKLTGNSKKAESPFASSVTSRITIRGKGALLYDPRRDSTVPGGSGTHRANDQTTWAWVSDDVGRNPALQLLWYLLGWRIQNPTTSAWKLAVGLGLPPERIDMPSFIAAANICDESVNLAAGGTEKRFRSDGVFSEADDPQMVFGNLLATMNGVLRDAGGKLALDILVNDLASPVLDLTEADVVGAVNWLQTTPIQECFNVVRGRYTNASDNSLYQLVDYPDVTLASIDGIERPATYDLPLVQSASQAQRLAKSFLQRAQYSGTFTADFLATAWRCNVGSVVRLTFPSLGFTNKLFRVIGHSIRFDGLCPMELREEHPSIYAWDMEESPAVTATAPITYNPLNEALIQAAAEAGTTSNWSLIVDDNGGKGTTVAGATAGGAAANSDGTIKDNKVATAAIIDNAITTPVSSFTAAEINVTDTSDYTTIQTAVITSPGSIPIKIDCSVECRSAGPSLDALFWFGIWRGATQIYNSTQQINVPPTYNRPIAFTIVDTPPAGTHTYTLRIYRHYANPSIYAGNRSLSLFYARK